MASCGSQVGQKLWENSGLALTQDAQGKPQLWAIADSGNAASLYRLAFDGRILAETKIQGAINDDWEDLASDGQGRVFIPDFGNNRRSPDKALTIYEIDVHADPKAKPKTSYFRYTDESGNSYPEQNAESLIWLAGHLYILTKHKKPTISHLFRIVTASPELRSLARKANKRKKGASKAKRVRFEGSRKHPFPAKYLKTVKLDRSDELFLFRRRATAADIDKYAQSLAILTYDQVLIYADPGLSPWKQGEIRSSEETDRRIRHLLNRPPRRVTLPLLSTGQCEGILWFEGDWWISNEGGRIWPIPKSGVKKATPM